MNEVILIGRLTKDPELRYTQSQTPVCNMTLAVDRPKSKDRQNNGPTADFIRIQVFGKQAENCSKYLSKGRQAAINGSIRTGSYEKDGRKVYTTDVVASRVEFIGGGNGSTMAKTGTYARAENTASIQEEYEGFEVIGEEDVPF